MRGLEAYEGAPVDRLREASRRAMRALVALAIDQEVDLVLLAGDIYDGDWTDFRTGLFFRDQLVQLTRAGIHVFIVQGNHDASCVITRELPAVEGVHVFSSQRGETVDRPDLGVAIHGRSFAQRQQTMDLLPDYPAPMPDRFNIGILHTSLNGRELHDPYAPTTVAALVHKGYDYFALGHVHAREVVRERHPRIVFSGNLQGRHARETGPKGCELITVEQGEIVASEAVSFDIVRWHHLTIDVGDLGSTTELSQRVVARLADLVAQAPECLHALRITLIGESPLHRLEARQPGSLRAAIAAAGQDLAQGDIWIEKLVLQLRSPLDREAAAARDDAVGEVIRLVNRLAADEAGLREWFNAQLLEEIGGSIPPGLRDLSPDHLDPATIRACLADAEATVLARIVEQDDGVDAWRNGTSAGDP